MLEMAQRVQFKNPPLIETTLYLGFLPTQRRMVGEIKLFAAKEFPDYAFKRELVKKDVNVKVTADGSVETSKSEDVEGAQFESAKSYVLSLKYNSYACTRINGYDNWELFCRESVTQSKKYSDFVVPKGVFRIGVRSIDRISILEYEKDFSASITTLPNVHSQFGNVEHMDFVHRDVCFFRDYGLYAELTRVLRRPPNKPPVVFLDSDVYALDPNLSHNLKLTDDLLVRIRDVKDELFFRSVSEDLKRRFE